jgi:hypothetical protein
MKELIVAVVSGNFFRYNPSRPRNILIALSHSAAATIGIPPSANNVGWLSDDQFIGKAARFSRFL